MDFYILLRVYLYELSKFQTLEYKDYAIMP
ncbi:hypothetical protein SAMN04487884_102246 [Butyrivibrio fibrisolvens]|uniref:Uncharacterized protein n=1 Tax=Butyrivibrio fibrisolvens TaxID=831 RepID=A0A1H9LZ97_BUTFI|nr:hypothetical protein SAMN04487884_102246 [Butyrivibrio fibrisolvens]